MTCGRSLGVAAQGTVTTWCMSRKEGARFPRLQVRKEGPRVVLVQWATCSQVRKQGIFSPAGCCSEAKQSWAPQGEASGAAHPPDLEPRESTP